MLLIQLLCIAISVCGAQATGKSLVGVEILAMIT